MGESVNSNRFIFLGSKITAVSDRSHKIKRCLHLGRKAMKNLKSMLKSRDITLLKSSVQFSHSVIPYSCDPKRTAAHQASLFITNSQSLLKLMSIASVMPSNHLIFCRSLLLPPSFSPALGSFPMSSLHQVSKVLEFQLQHQSFQWIFRTDFL